MMYIIVVNKRKGLEQRQIRRKDKLTNTGHNIKLNARLNNNILYKSIIQSTQNTHTHTQFKTNFLRNTSNTSRLHPLSSLLTHLDGHEKAFQGRGDGLGNNLGDVGVCIGVTSLVYLLGGVGRLE
jgi:hypothetical protein